MDLKKFSLMLLVLIACCNSQAYAIRVAEFDDFVFKDSYFYDRSSLSLDVGDFDFKSSESFDFNCDGAIDYFEENTFATFAPAFSVYVGNASSRVELQNTLLWVGVDGAFDSFELNGLKIENKDTITNIYSDKTKWPSDSLKPMVDSIILIDLECGLSKRSSIHDPVATSIPFEVQFSSLESTDDALRLYFACAGSIKSGFNSFSSSDSDVLFMNNPSVAPEPMSICLFSLGSLFLMGIKFFNRKVV